MGLDMYLNKVIYLGGNYPHAQVVGKLDVTVKGVPLVIDASQIVSVVLPAIRWRKAHSIHEWFCSNTSFGESGGNGGKVIITREELQELYNDICDVLNDPMQAENLLPNDEDDYGVDYVEELLFTRDELEKIIAEFPHIDVGTGDVYWEYSADW